MFIKTRTYSNKIIDYFDYMFIYVVHNIYWGIKRATIKIKLKKFDGLYIKYNF